MSIVFISTAAAQNYKNPVIEGDFPDPSIIRVGSDYYAAATTGNWNPPFTILHSQDLVNWKVIGSVFSQKPVWAKGDFWAPEIITDKNRYFVFYAGRRDEGKNKKGTLCVAVASASKPEGPYVDNGTLVCQEMGSIDPAFVRDENGKPYLVWKEDGNDRQQPTWLYAQELTEDLLKLKGNPTKLFRNTEAWEKNVVEGSYILRHNGWFYHFYSGNACCGRACDYALGVARSKTLLGKWEKFDKNPILTANETWQCPGHGSIVKTANGDDYLLYHAYRRRTDAFNIGREALLDKIQWTNDGWAMINDGRGPSNGASLPFANASQKPLAAIDDEFDGAQIEPAWQFPLGDNQSFHVADGFLEIAPTNSQPANEKTVKSSEYVLAERTVSGSFTATTRIDFSKLKAGESAGISVYSWQKNAIGISIGDGKVFAWKRDNGGQQEIGKAVLSSESKTLLLRITAKDGEMYKFEFGSDEPNLRQIGESLVNPNIEGARIALICDGKSKSSTARFDWLHVVPENK